MQANRAKCGENVTLHSLPETASASKVARGQEVGIAENSAVLCLVFNRQNHISIKTKMKILSRMVLLAVSSLALAATSAQAQTTINTNIGDLILGFRVTDGLGQGATKDLEVD